MKNKFKDKFESERDPNWDLEYNSEEVDIEALKEKYDTSIDSKETSAGKRLGEFPLNYDIKAYSGEEINDEDPTFLSVNTEDPEVIKKDEDMKILKMKNEAIRGNFSFYSDVGHKTDSHKDEIWDAPKYGDGVPTENEVEDVDEEKEEETLEELGESMVQQFSGEAKGFVPCGDLPPTNKEIEDSTWDPDKEYYITDENQEESDDAEDRKSAKEKLDTRKERLRGLGMGPDIPNNIADRKKDNYTYKRSQKRNSALSKPHREKPIQLAKNKIRENIQKRLKDLGVI